MTCAKCYRRTNCVQAVEVPSDFGGNERVSGCPRCVRTRLWELIASSMISPLFPVMALVYLVTIHGSKRAERPGIPAEFAHWANLGPPPPREQISWRTKAIHILVAIVIWACLLGVGIYVRRLTSP